MPASSLPFSEPRRGFVHRVQSVSAVIHRISNGSIVLGVVLQFYGIGLVMFGVTGMGIHRTTGSFLLLAGLVSSLAAVIAGQGRARALALFVLLLLQPALALGFRGTAPAVAALHAVNGLLILALAVYSERRMR